MVVGLGVDDPDVCFRSVRQCKQAVLDACLEIPHWQEWADSPFPREHQPEPSQEAGWQQRATEKLEQKFVCEEVWLVLSDSTRALLWSWHGPLVAAPLIAFPTKATRLEAQPFRGQHRAACVMGEGRRDFLLEVVAAHVCREVGACVSITRDVELVEFNKSRRTTSGFVQSLRSSRGGATAGPSGMTADHLQPLLCDCFGARPGSRCSSGRGKDGSDHCAPSRTEASEELWSETFFEGWSPEQWPNKMAARAEAAMAPFQHTLTTKAGCESVAHILRSLIDQDERATIVSIDGVGAHDLISRNAMLEGMASVFAVTGCCHSCGISIPVNVPLGGSGRRDTHDPSRRGRGTGRPPDAHAL